MPTVLTVQNPALGGGRDGRLGRDRARRSRRLSRRSWKVIDVAEPLLIFTFPASVIVRVWPLLSVRT